MPQRVHGTMNDRILAPVPDGFTSGFPKDGVHEICSRYPRGSWSQPTVARWTTTPRGGWHTSRLGDPPLRPSNDDEFTDPGELCHRPISGDPGPSRSATRSREVGLTVQTPEGSYVHVPTRRSMTVAVEKGSHPVSVRGYGINEARFATLQEVYDTFCRPFAPIRLDYEGGSIIEQCLYDLGFVPPRPY